LIRRIEPWAADRDDADRMQIRGGESFVEILCPAKLNLYLEVKGRRSDGYHEIESVMQTVSIYDRLLIEPAASGTHLSCNDPAIPEGDANTVCRAVEEMRRATGIDAGVNIRLEKNVPAGAGLAGGSSDAAGTIAGLNVLWETGLSQPRLTEIGAAVGSDVPFFFWAGTALCRGRGEKVTPLSMPGALHLVIVWPGYEISTGEIYRRLDVLGLTDRGENDTIDKFTQQLGSVGPTRPGVQIAQHFFNRLEEPALRLHGELGEVKRLMAEEGLLGVTMTGSGSAFFGLCERKEAARQIKQKLAASGIGLVFACESTKE